MAAITDTERLLIAQQELSSTKQELAKVRRKLAERGRHADRIQRAYTDALLLAGNHISYLNTSRRESEELFEMTRRRWEGALGLLRLANVHTGKKWRSNDLEYITACLDKARRIALEYPESYYMRLCKHADQRKPRTI